MATTPDSGTAKGAAPPPAKPDPAAPLNPPPPVPPSTSGRARRTTQIGAFDGQSGAGMHVPSAPQVSESLQRSSATTSARPSVPSASISDAPAMHRAPSVPTPPTSASGATYPPPSP